MKDHQAPSETGPDSANTLKHPYAVTFDSISTEPLDAWMAEQLEKLEASHTRFSSPRALRETLGR